MQTGGIEGAVHNLVGRMFPFNVAAGWAYKGFALGRDEGRVVVNLRFEKTLIGRRGFAVLHVFAETINLPGYDLKAWVLAQLEKEEAALLARHHADVEGAH